MRIALIVYHKNIGQYPKEWIEAFKSTIDRQTYKNTPIYELDYGGDGERIFDNCKFYNTKFSNFAEGMNFLIDRCFEDGMEYVLNTNCDDFYTLNRIEKQCAYMMFGYDVISSNFALVKDDEVTLVHEFHNRNIKEELDRDHNIICHPIVAISKRFWEGNRYIPSEIPFEDMKLWQRGLNEGYKFVVLPDVLCYHRLHNESVGHKLKEE